MLHEFLEMHRTKILALCARKISKVANSVESSDLMDRGLPLFYDELIEVLRCGKDKTTDPERENDTIAHGAALRGKESHRLGYTLSQVVHSYGALCQAITEYAAENSGDPILANEFNRLNLTLDIGIAEAVTEFDRGQREEVNRQEVIRLGALAHELRNSLSNAAMAHRMIQKGVVGVSGNTSQILEDAHKRMRDIIDRSLAEVRLQGEPRVEFERCRVLHLISDVEITATIDASAKAIQLQIEIPSELEVFADRHLVTSAIANLVQNAIKFTKPNGTIQIRATSANGEVLIEVEDECGGLPPGKIEELFQPFSQKGSDKSGIGLGLTISRRAISLNEGTLSARDLPGKGCVFSIQLPQCIY